VLLDVPEEEVAARLAGSQPDRMEAAGDEFHRAVAAGFLRLADADDSWVVIDGVGSEDEVAARVLAAVESHLS